MPTADQTRANSPACQHHDARPLVMTVVFLVAFASGFCTSLLLCQERVRDDGQRRFQEFLLNADRLGIIDHERLDELIRDGHNVRP